MLIVLKVKFFVHALAASRVTRRRHRSCVTSCCGAAARAHMMKMLDGLMSRVYVGTRGRTNTKPCLNCKRVIIGIHEQVSGGLSSPTHHTLCAATHTHTHSRIYYGKSVLVRKAVVCVCVHRLGLTLTPKLSHVKMCVCVLFQFFLKALGRSSCAHIG